MSGGTFRRVGKSETTLYGPRAMLICGFPGSEKNGVVDLVRGIGLENLSVVFASADDGTARVGELLARPDMSGLNSAHGPVRAIVLSGITEKELHMILSRYRESGMPRPLWATLTPVSVNWCLADLLSELDAERRAMEKRSS